MKKTQIKSSKKPVGKIDPRTEATKDSGKIKMGAGMGPKF